uniref:hypothetical protein n=1 Tax=uncultured Dysgonomonas sp. TaxID=206096 RepID=UPI00260DAC5C|nr:hypothetical protein [uncultured Dysgonomonas sp.]
MNQKFSENLVNAIKNALPAGTNVALYLMDLLSLGKEAVYRRLRGTVSFDIEESALISKDLNISLDHIIGMKSDDKAIFDLNLIRKSDMLDDYCRFINNYIQAFRQLRLYSNSKSYSAYNVIPLSFYTQYDLISKFYWYKWLYQMEGFDKTTQFSQFSFPSRVAEIHKSFIEESRFIENSSFVLARNIFISLAMDVDFFLRLNLLTKAEVQQIKVELIELLIHLESVAASGLWNGDKEVSFYLSNMNFESSYTYLECAGFELSIFRVFSFGSICSRKDQVCKVHKDWLDSLKRSSTLISQSGDVHRAEYFNEQKEVIDSIL